MAQVSVPTTSRRILCGHTSSSVVAASIACLMRALSWAVSRRPLFSLAAEPGSNDFVIGSVDVEPLTTVFAI